MHDKHKFENEILYWTFHNCALMAIYIGDLPKSVTVSMGDESAKNVRLDPKTEAIVSLTELDLFICGWLDSAVKSGWTMMNEEDLDQFLNFVPNKTWFYLKVSQQAKESYYFVMLFSPHVSRRPLVSLQ